MQSFRIVSKKGLRRCLNIVNDKCEKLISYRIVDHSSQQTKYNNEKLYYPRSKTNVLLSAIKVIPGVLEYSGALLPRHDIAIVSFRLKQGD